MQQYGLTPCPKCGGKRAAVATSSGTGIISQPQRDPGWVGNKNTTTIQSSACTICGYLELYAREPEKLVPDS